MPRRFISLATLTGLLASLALFIMLKRRHRRPELLITPAEEAAEGLSVPTSARTEPTPRRNLVLPAIAASVAVLGLLLSVGIVSATSAVATPAPITQPVKVQTIAAKQSGPAIPAELAAEAVAAAWTVNNSMFTCIRWAESNNRYELVSGAYGILISSWQAYRNVWQPFGEFATPGDAPRAVQDLVAFHLYRVGGGYGGWHNYCTGR